VAPLECLHLILEIQTFVKVIPTGAIYKSVSLCQADRQFGSKFGIASGLASLDWTNMWLTYTDDSVINPDIRLYPGRRVRPAEKNDAL